MAELFDVDAWLTDVTRGANVTPEQLEILKTVLAQDTVVKELSNSQLRQSDFSRNQDALRVKEEAAQKKYDDTESFYQRIMGEDHNNQAIHDSHVTEIARLKTGGGNTGDGDDGDHGDLTRANLEGYITKEDHDKSLQASDRASLQVGVTIIKLTNQYRDDYGKSLDPDTVIAHTLEMRRTANDDSITLDEGYLDMTKDLRAEKQKESFDAEVKAGVEEALKEERSNRPDGFPDLTSGPSGVHAIRDRSKTIDLSKKEDRVGDALSFLRDKRQQA